MTWSLDLQVWILYLFQISFLLYLFSGYVLAGAPLVVIFLHWELFWPPGEPEKDKGETEEPEVFASKQAKVHRACTWLEEGGVLALAEDRAEGLLFQVSWSSQAFSSYILFWCFVSYALASGYVLESPGLSAFFQGLHQLLWANFLRQEADYLQLKAKGLQQIEFTITGLGAEGLYDLIWEAVTQPELSVSVGSPLPKRHKWVATATVSSPTAQKSEAIIPKPEGGVSV